VRIIFISEHLIIDSHTGEVIEGLKKNSDFLDLIDYKIEYFRLGKKKFENEIYRKISINKVDLIIINLGNARVLDPIFIASISNKFKVKVVILFPDPEHMFEGHDRYYAQAADICWVSNKGAGTLFQIYGSTTYDKFGLSKNYRNYINVEKKFDTSFVGSLNRGDRKEYLNFLDSKNLNLYVAGYQTKNGELSSKEKDSIIQQSWIHINFSKVENKDLNIFKRVRQYKGRIHETCMLGTLPLTEYYNGIEHHFPHDYKDISFTTKSEMYEKIKYFLENKEITLALSEKLKINALREFDINVVLKELFDVINSKKIEEKYIYLDRLFLRSYISQRLYYIGRFIAILKFDAMLCEVSYVIRNIKGLDLKDICFQLARGIYHSIKY
jgi:hypothetical protein